MNEIDALALLKKSGCSRDVIQHCKTVAVYARKIAVEIIKRNEKKCNPVNIDVEAVFLGGLLHDLGRSRTHGIDHAVAGAKIAKKAGLSLKLINIIERHIGAGITKDEAKALGIPEKDYIPLTMEEKIVAHADNLVFGDKIGTIDELLLNLRKKELDEKAIQRIINLNNEICSMME